MTTTDRFHPAERAGGPSTRALRCLFAASALVGLSGPLPAQEAGDDAAAEAAAADAEGPAEGLPVAELERSEPVNYLDEVFPALKRNCLACHNATKAKAGLNLESAEAMVAGGDSGPALVPGRADESLVFLSAAHLEDPAMPPSKNKSNARNLTPRELALFKRWIDEGATGGDRWAGQETIAWRSSVAAEAPVYRVAASRDGRLAAAARGRDVTIYNVASGIVEGDLNDPEIGATHLDYVQAIAFGPGGVVATGGFRTIKVWRREAIIEPGAAPGGEIAGAEGAGLLPWMGGPPETTVARAEDGSLAVRLPGADGPREIRWSPGADATFLAIDGAGAVAATIHPDPPRLKVWEIAEAKLRFETGPAAAEAREVDRLKQREETAKALAGVREQQAAEAAKVRDEEAKKLEEAVAAFAAADAEFKAKESAHSAAAAAKAALEEELRQLEEAKAEGIEAKKQEIEARTKEVETAAAELDNASKERTSKERNRDLAQRLAENAQNEVAAGEARKEEAAQALAGATGSREAAELAAAAAETVAFSSVNFDATTGILIAALGNGTALVIDPLTGALADRLPGAVADGGIPGAYAVKWRLARTLGSIDDPSILADRVLALDISADGRWLVAGSGVPSRSGILTTFDLESGEREWVRDDAHSDAINDVALSPDGRLVATASSDRLVRVFSMDEGNPLRTFEGHGSYATGVAWRADGLRLATCGTDNTVRLWESETSKPLDTRKNFKRGVAAVAYRGPADEIVAAAGDPSLRVENDSFFGEGTYLHDVAVAEGGATIVAGAQDGVLRVWTWPDKKLLRAFEP